MSRFVKLTISSIYFIGDIIRRCLLRMVGIETPGRCIVIYYHSIPREQQKKFSRQMDYILRYAKPISADIRNSIEPGSNYVSITFDDGFLCVVENAVPELIRRNIPFVIFVPSGNLGTPPEWIKNNVYDDVIMDDRQLRQLTSMKNARIGSHCVSHKNLLLLDEHDARKELVDSKRALQEILKQEVELLSFPHGAYDDRLIEMAKKAGYLRVFTTLPVAAFSQAEEFVSGRVRVDPGDWDIEFLLKIQGAYQWLPAAFKLKKQLQLPWI